MITFQDQYTLAQQMAGLSDATSLVGFKRDINQGGTMFSASLGRDYNRQERFASLIAGQADYQLPEDALRVISVTASDGTTRQPLVQIPDEDAYSRLHQTSTTGTPTHFFIKGFDIVSLYPAPAAAVTGGLTVSFQPKHMPLSQADYTTGTIHVTHSSDQVLHSAQGFRPSLVGQYLNVADGSDGRWYRVQDFVNTSLIGLENVYQGSTNAAVPNGSWRIGEVMNLPEEYLEAPVDYAMYRHYLKRGNSARAGEFKALFKMAVDTARDHYGMATASQVIWADAASPGRPYNFIRDNPSTIG